MICTIYGWTPCIGIDPDYRKQGSVQNRPRTGCFRQWSNDESRMSSMSRTSFDADEGFLSILVPYLQNLDVILYNITLIILYNNIIYYFYIYYYFIPYHIKLYCMILYHIILCSTFQQQFRLFPSSLVFLNFDDLDLTTFPNPSP